jgi:hypothetical protein
MEENTPTTLPPLLTLQDEPSRAEQIGYPHMSSLVPERGELTNLTLPKLYFG